MLRDGLSQICKYLFVSVFSPQNVDRYSWKAGVLAWDLAFSTQELASGSEAMASQKGTVCVVAELAEC